MNHNKSGDHKGRQICKWGGIIRHKTKRKKHWIFYFIIVIFMIITIVSVIDIENRIGPVARKQGEYYSEMVANKVINETVSEYLNENVCQYSDFATVLYDENGTAVSIESLTYNINKVQSDLTLKISEKFSDNSSIKTKIPIGSLTDSYLLSGKGIKVPLSISSDGNVEVSLKSEFISAGINQTCHRISAIISTDIQSSVPLYSFSSKAEFEFILAENVIVGNVPDYHSEKIY